MTNEDKDRINKMNEWVMLGFMILIFVGAFPFALIYHIKQRLIRKENDHASRD